VEVLQKDFRNTSTTKIWLARSGGWAADKVMAEIAELAARG